MTTTLADTSSTTTSVLAAAERAVAPYAAIYPGRVFDIAAETERDTSVDSSTLHHVLTGLLSSACRRSTISAPVLITIRDADGGVVVDVVDQSHGFSDGALEQLRAPSRMPRLVDDAALRAAWAARDAGAIVDVASASGHGTTVSVQLPLPLA